jgi:hypothetical protein
VIRASWGCVRSRCCYPLLGGRAEASQTESRWSGPEDVVSGVCGEMGDLDDRVIDEDEQRGG